MLKILLNFILTHWVYPLTLQTYVKNPDAPCSVAYTDVGEGREHDSREGGGRAKQEARAEEARAEEARAEEARAEAAGSFVVLVKGIAINGERRLAGYAGISHQYMFNCGIQVK